MPCNFIWKELPKQIVTEVVEPLKDKISEDSYKKMSNLLWYNLPNVLNEFFDYLFIEYPDCITVDRNKFIWFNLNKKAETLCAIKDLILDCEEDDTIIAVDDNVGFIWLTELDADPECGSCGLWIEGFNILQNDTIRGEEATLLNVSLTQLTELSNFLIQDGKLYIKATEDLDTQLQYQICDIEDNSFCDTALVDISVISGEVELLSITPDFLCDGSNIEQVTITGNNFYGSTPLINAVTDVLFDGVSAQSFTIVNRGTIVALPPIEVTEGDVTVEAPIDIVGSPLFFSITTPPVVNPITGDDAVCTEDTIVLASTSPGGTWSSADEDIATVVSGTVTPVSEGEVDILYSVTDNGCTTVVSKTINVYEKVELGRFATTRSAIPTENDSFYVEATGSGLNYQWFAFDGIDTFEIDALTSFDGETYTGFTTNTLIISGITDNLNGFEFYCEIDGTAPCASETTQGANNGSNSILNVGATGILVHPQDQEECEGQSVVFSITANGDPVNTYQWEYDQNDDNWLSVPTGTLDGMTVVGEDTNTLTISNILSVNSGYRFRCLATGDSNIATSDFGILTVNEC